MEQTLLSCQEKGEGSLTLGPIQVDYLNWHTHAEIVRCAARCAAQGTHSGMILLGEGI